MRRRPCVQSLLAELTVSVLALTETWFDSNSEEFVKIPGYRSVLRSRVGGGGGGVGFLVREGIVHQCIDLDKLGVTSNTFECLFIQLNFKRGSCIMGVVYRPPGQNLEEFNIEIDHLLTELSKRGKDVILLEDFNVDLLKVSEHKRTNSFYNCLIAHHLLPVITRPTRITDHSSTLIDNLFTNAWPKLINSSIIASDISDHLPIIVRFNFEVFRYGSGVQRLLDARGQRGSWMPSKIFSIRAAKFLTNFFLSVVKFQDNSLPGCPLPCCIMPR